MKGWILRCAVVVAAAGVLAPAAVGVLAPALSVAGPGGYAGQSRTVESTVREIDQTHQTVYLANGTLLSTNDVKLLQQLAPGVRIRVAFEERAGGQNFINRLEVIP